jgi:hypothetical protein
LTHPAAETIGPVTFAVLSAPDSTVIVAGHGELHAAVAALLADADAWRDAEPRRRRPAMGWPTPLRARSC